jgi:protein gp37
MAQKTAIEWTDLTWNPVHGCSKVSPGCAHCYAAELSLRYQHTTKPWTPANADENVLLKPHKLREPLRTTGEWAGLGTAAAAAGKTDGKLVFVNSMSDLFHENVPFGFTLEVFKVMAAAERHTFQILTKRAERMQMMLWHLLAELERDEPLPNVWLGVSIENRRFVHRADLLRQTPAAVRFVSAEPLLGPLIASHHLAVPPVDDRGDEDPEDWEVVPFWDDQYCPGGPDELDLTEIDWLIVGGESGSGHRPMREQWAADLRDACLTQRRSLGPDRFAPSAEGDTAFFFKQWGGARPGGEALLDGREWREFPQPRAVAA